MVDIYSCGADVTLATNDEGRAREKPLLPVWESSRWSEQTNTCFLSHWARSSEKFDLTVRSDFLLVVLSLFGFMWPHKELRPERNYPTRSWETRWVTPSSSRRFKMRLTRAVCAVVTLMLDAAESCHVWKTSLWGLKGLEPFFLVFFKTTLLDLIIHFTHYTRISQFSASDCNILTEPLNCICIIFKLASNVC